MFAVMMSLTAIGVFGQAKPMKWGKIPIEDLQMTSYAADSNANAVILGEYGEITVDQTGQLSYNYHLRVKLLSEAAYDEWGTYRLFYFKGKYGQRIRNVEGQTFVLDANGKPKRHKLGKKSVFKEKLDDDYEQLNFTLPALAPGAVVEYRYKMISDSPIFLPDWDFQHSEPTRWSEIRTDLSDFFQYVRVTTVYNFAIEEQDKNISPGANSMVHRWAMKDVPALREEPFVTTIEDHRLKMEFQLARYYTNAGMTNYMKSWGALADELRANSYYGPAFKPSKNVRRKAEEITAGITNPKAKLQSIYDYVQTNHQWNGNYSYVPERAPADVLKSDRASNAEQALLMVALLRAVNIKANPVLISTRGHGRVKKEYPLLTQFNYLIAQADAGGYLYFLDATEENSPFDALPERALNSAGWMVAENRDEWIPVKSNLKYMQLNALEGKMNPDGSVNFDLSSSNGGYRALELRNALEGSDQSEFVLENIIEKTGEFELSDIAIANTDSLSKPLNVDVGVKINNYGMVAGDFIYFNPHAVSTWEENPLKLPQRTFPVDFSFPRDYVYSFRMEIPEGYTVHEQPGNVNYRLPLKGGAFRRTCITEGSTLVVQSRLTLTNATYSPKVYAELQEMYDRIVAAEADQVVLKKVAPGTGDE